MLHTDASEDGIRAVLFQEFDGQGTQIYLKKLPSPHIRILGIEVIVCHKFHE